METKVKSKYEKGSEAYADVLTGDVDRKIANAPKNIPGWGIDADRENDPTYPMKNRTDADYERIHYEKAVQQPVTVEVFRSIERPAITRVFGASTPPRGLSGRIRQFAYRFSEADARHWLTLVMADRVDVVEGIIDDLKQGIIPNIFAERGWAAEFKYNRKAAVQKVAIGAAVGAALITVLLLRNNRKSKSSLPVA
ncbi:MAG TPA: hypothetical protein VGD65_10250 [Chryseosolibacter sp.]